MTGPVFGDKGLGGKLGTIGVLGAGKNADSQRVWLYCLDFIRLGDKIQ